VLEEAYNKANYTSVTALERMNEQDAVGKYRLAPSVTLATIVGQFGSKLTDCDDKVLPTID
jgi:hypothetical protein